MKNLSRHLVAAALAVGIPSSAAAQRVLGFENFAPLGGVVNVNPGAPYREGGYTLTPATPASAVYDAATGVDFPGRSDSSFLGFSPSNALTLTRDGGLPFDFFTAILGRRVDAVGPPGGPVDFTLVGNFAAGGSTSQAFHSLTDATLATLNWTNLSSVVFSASNDAALDDVTVTAPPPPPPPTGPATISFEGFVPAGGVVNVNPGAPYTESGYTLTPATAASAIYDADTGVDFPGRSDSSFFGFSPSNFITLTRNDGAAFDFLGVILGPLKDFAGPTPAPVTVTIVGNFAGGGSTSQTFSDLSSATTATLGWTGLASVVFSTASANNVVLDDISVYTAPAAPEPASLALLACAGAGVLPVAGAWFRRRRAG